MFEEWAHRYNSFKYEDAKMSELKQRTSTKFVFFSINVIEVNEVVRANFNPILTIKEIFEFLNV